MATPALASNKWKVGNDETEMEEIVHASSSRQQPANKFHPYSFSQSAVIASIVTSIRTRWTDQPLLLLLLPCLLLNWSSTSLPLPRSLSSFSYSFVCGFIAPRLTASFAPVVQRQPVKRSKVSRGAYAPNRRAIQYQLNVQSICAAAAAAAAAANEYTSSGNQVFTIIEFLNTFPRSPQLQEMWMRDKINIYYTV
jgi:uncharacterized membrane protein